MDILPHKTKSALDDRHKIFRDPGTTHEGGWATKVGPHRFDRGDSRRVSDRIRFGSRPYPRMGV